MKNIFYPKEWFFVIMQVISFFVTAWALVYHLNLNYWILSLFGYFIISCLGITMTFHRLLTHRSYQLVKPLEYIFTFFGNLGCTGSSVAWVIVHKKHHKHADKHGDPHSPIIHGPWGAFVGDYTGKFNKWSVKNLIKDPVHRFMHEYYIGIVLATVLILGMIDNLILIHLFFIPVFFNTVASRLSNWIDHSEYFGKRSYNTFDHSRNVWWWALFTFGEGWHNNHHRFPGDYKIGRSWYEIDIGKYVIDFFIIIGLAKSKVN